MPFTPQEHMFMARALRLAARAHGEVEPNPLVGAVLVKNNRIVGEGYHQHFGGPHAEIVALRKAGGRAKGATLYVTLEPCCHFGKTPPCTDAIIPAGIRRVVAAMVDPFAKVRGQGIALLRKAGIAVEVGLMEEEARALNAPFITRVGERRPFVIAKWAQSLDGCIATASGESKWISSETSRAFVQKLRGRMDAIVVGIQTALADDPLLIARPEKGRDIHRIATRIVLDSTCRLPVNSQLVKTVSHAPVFVVHGRNPTGAAERRRRALADRGVQTVGMAVDRNNRPQVRALLRHLADLDYTNVLVEGGPTLLASLFQQKLVDESHIFIAPILIGGPHARHALLGPDLTRLANAHKLRIVSSEMSGPDLHVVARPSRD